MSLDGVAASVSPSSSGNDDRLSADRCQSSKHTYEHRERRQHHVRGSILPVAWSTEVLCSDHRGNTGRLHRRVLLGRWIAPSSSMFAEDANGYLRAVKNHIQRVVFMTRSGFGSIREVWVEIRTKSRIRERYDDRAWHERGMQVQEYNCRSRCRVYEPHHP